MPFFKKLNSDNLKQSINKLKDKGLALAQRIFVQLKKVWAWAKQHPKKAAIAVIILYALYKGILFILPKDDPAKRMVQTVVTAVAEQKDFPVILETTGNTVAQNIVDVRPQVTNVVAKIHIKEGQQVKEGDLLFSLDDRADKANYEKAKALAEDALRQYKRSEELVKQNFISKAALDTSKANYQSLKAAANAAEVLLSYDYIKASISGTVGVINVFPGTLVQPGNTVTTTTSASATSTTAALATITQLNPMNVQFTVPESNLSALIKEQAETGGLEVEISLANGDKKTGKVYVIDNQVDASIGAIKVKAQFENPDASIVPGQFVQIKLKAKTIKDALVVPSQAIISNSKGTQIYISDADNKVILKPIQVLAQSAGYAAISGINPGDKVIVEGQQNLRPGSKFREAQPSQNKK